jgi:hypothetical protein
MDFAIRRQSFCKVAPPLAVVLAASTLTALGSGRPKSGRPYFQTASGQPLPPEPMAPGDRAPSRQLAMLANRYADFCSCAIRGGGSLTIPFFGHPFFFAGATLESRFLVTRFFFFAGATLEFVVCLHCSNHFFIHFFCAIHKTTTVSMYTIEPFFFFEGIIRSLRGLFF